MPSAPQPSLADTYVVDDLPSANQIGSRLNGILASIHAGATVSQRARDYLRQSGLTSLHALVEAQIDRAGFEHSALLERGQRMALAKVAAHEASVRAAKLEAERAEASAAFFRDPAVRRRQENKQLRSKFTVGYIEPEHFPRAMRLLRALCRGARLAPMDVAWLQTKAVGCWTDAVASAWHRIEAEILTSAWRKEGKLWDAVNASSHWRKAGQPDEALRLTGETQASTAISDAKVQSALATTRGGAMRDLGRFEEAQACGKSAHDLAPKDYRPCTLLGAVHFQLGDLAAGYRWFAKAEQLGAGRAIVDQDIKSLLARVPPDEKARIRTFLLNQDPERFAWLKPSRSARDHAARSPR